MHIFPTPISIPILNVNLTVFCLFVFSFSCLCGFIQNQSCTIHSCWMMLLKPVCQLSNVQVLLQAQIRSCCEIVLGMLKIYQYVKNIIYMKLCNLNNPSKKIFSSKLNLDALQLVFSPCGLGQKQRVLPRPNV